MHMQDTCSNYTKMYLKATVGKKCQWVHYKHVNHVFIYLCKVDYKSNMYTFMYATLILNYNKAMHIT